MERKAKGFYFHGRAAASLREIKKCKTSIYSKKDFAKEKRQGKVLFRVVDITTPEGKKMAKDYRVTWSSLFVNGWKNGKEKRNDLTQFAFKVW